MKRRDFLALGSLFALTAGEALASPQPPKKKKPAPKPVARKPQPRKKPVVAASAGPAVVHSADSPLIDNPVQGTSASRLPPVRAQELPSEWRTYEIVTTLHFKTGGQASSLWLALPYGQDSIYQRTLGHRWQGNASTSTTRRQPDNELEVFHCNWKDVESAQLKLTTQVMTADRHFDITRRTVAPDREDILRRNLQATRLIPNEGLIQQLSRRIVGGIKDPVAQVKAIYDWICDNAIYDPSLPGCGTGDVNAQLISGQYGGRSADINGLFVAACRSIGIPARCVYGLRIGPSRLFRSLGLSGQEAAQAFHVRAEFYLPGFGWIPANPSDVRRAIAYEALSDKDSRLTALRRVLFGIWEMNWVALNHGNELQLPDFPERLPFFLRPRLQIGARGLHLPDPAIEQFSITARQIEL